MTQNPVALEVKPVVRRHDERMEPLINGIRADLLPDSEPVSTDIDSSHGMSGQMQSAAGSSLLLASLQRLYDGNAGPGPDPTIVSMPTESAAGPSSSTEYRDYDLSASLLEAVFEISDFDPLPQLIRGDDDFNRTDSALRDRAERLRESRRRHDSPAPSPAPANTWSRERVETHRPVRPIAAAGSGIDRRKLPRRESECQVVVCPCTTEDRLTADRISWLLHAAQLKGTLVDVSMSGISLCLAEPLAADSKILLRITNRTIDEHVDTSAVVLRSQATPDGDWNIVCRFNKNLTFEQIHVVGRSLFAATIV